MKRRTLKHKTIRAFSDAGHAWARVSRHELIDLNIIHLISGCSYERKDKVYLEEDCDLNTYVTALRRNNPSISIEYNVTTSNLSKIRQYTPFSASALDIEEQYIQNNFFTE